MTQQYRGAAAAIAALLLPLLPACSPDLDAAKADFHDAAGRHIGTATLQPTSEGILVTVRASSLPPGEHGFHVHERGKCEPPDFTSAGSHFNPHGVEHGLADADDEAHMGDMLNLHVAEDGRVVAHRVIEGATLDENADATSTSLLREGGTTLVIHAQPDDYVTDPAGASGARIACAVIQPER